VEKGQVMVFSKALNNAEKGVSRFLMLLRDHAKLKVPIDIPKAVAWAENEAGISLDPLQQEAVEAALQSPVLIITGGPGVGKTTIIRCIAKILTMKRCELAMAAPTGRAARRLSEATGFKAKTIHRLLGFNPHAFRFEHDEKTPLTSDVVIIDESSMIDVPLMDKLVRAIRPRARLILVGDADQLPSVGPGELLTSMIGCGAFRVVRLKRLFRQAKGSGITIAAHSVNEGKVPDFTSAGEDGEVFFFNKPDPEEAADEVVDLVCCKIPSLFNLDSMADIQVLAPMHKGPAGTENMNRRIQAVLNPKGPDVTRFNRTFRVGDKVMQTRNNYKLDVYNGEIGYVHSVDKSDALLKVRMDNRLVEYKFDNIDELILAYAVSVHKSQGSEFPAVVIPLLTQHFLLLKRNLLYTGLTRARKLLVLVGARKALHIAVNNSQSKDRYTLLEERLMH